MKTQVLFGTGVILAFGQPVSALRRQGGDPSKLRQNTR
jgi:hypothetical protein